jgi:hypothetical protein
MLAVSTTVFHVTSSRNRASIAQHGLDWRRWHGEPGVAGPDGAPLPYVFLARDDGEVDWFIWMSRRYMFAVDVWEVILPHDFDVYSDGASVGGGHYQEIDGYLCTTEPVPPECVRLLRRAV